jgi:ankyrin repeat protein
MAPSNPQEPDTQVVAEYGSSSSSSVAEEPPDYDELTEMLYDACDQGAVQGVHRICQAGADVNRRTRYEGACPVHAACERGHAYLLPILKKYGANLDEPDMDGWTPAHLGSANGHVQVMQVLAHLGANTNAVNEYNNLTPANVWSRPLPS